METYKNDYTKQEDELLWEIHEIRHNLIKEFESRSIDEINKQAKAKYEEWKKNYKK